VLIVQVLAYQNLLQRHFAFVRLELHQIASRVKIVFPVISSLNMRILFVYLAVKDTFSLILGNVFVFHAPKDIIKEQQHKQHAKYAQKELIKVMKAKLIVLIAALVNILTQMVLLCIRNAT